MDIRVNSSQELQSAFARADDGDRIRLAPGDYEWTRLSGRDFEDGVTVTSADPDERATFTERLLLQNTSGVTLEGVDIEAEGLADAAGDSRLYLRNTEDIVLRDIEIEGHVPQGSEGASPESGNRTAAIRGFGYEFGLRIDESERVSVEDVEITDVRVAMLLSDLTDAELDDLDIHEVREGINLFDVENLTIEDSQFYDFRPWKPWQGNGDHPDMIQYWGINSQEGVRDLTIRDNHFEQPAGSFTQTIFGHMRGAGAGVRAEDFTITGNTIVNGHAHGISLAQVDGAEISGNTLVPNGTDVRRGFEPRIDLTEVRNVEVTGNAVLPRHDGAMTNLSEGELNAARVVVEDNIALSDDPRDPLYWGDYLDGRPTLSERDEDARDDETNGEETGGESDDDHDENETDDETDDETDGGARFEVEREIVEGALPEDLARIEGGAGDDKLRAEPGGSHLDGKEGDDRLYEAAGMDILTGGAGADRFVFDYRSQTGPSRDVITDLDFDEGDRLIAVGAERGSFDDEVDPGNRLITVAEGSAAHIQSLEDLREAAEGGAVEFVEGAGDSLVLRFAEAPDRALEILTLTIDDVLF